MSDATVTYEVTFKVDQSALFDMLHKLNGDTSALGERLVATLLQGKPDWRDEVGMAAYGVTALSNSERTDG